MKIKTEELEKLLRRSGAVPPKGLRQRTLRRLRLKPAPRPWALRPLVWGPALASLCLVIWALRPSTPTPTNVAEPAEVTSEARNEELAYARRHPGLPGPTTSMQVMQARALMKVEDQATAGLHQDFAAAVGVQPGSASSQQTRVPSELLPGAKEALAAPASGTEAALKGWDEAAARGEAGKPASQPYRLTVKHNRVRPALGENVRLELVSPEPGHVSIRLYDAESRLLKVFADLNDPAGPIVVEWDGRLDDGRTVASGAYTFVIQTPKKTEKVGALVVR